MLKVSLVHSMKCWVGSGLRLSIERHFSQVDNRIIIIK